MNFVKILKKITSSEEYNYEKGKGELGTNGNVRYACYLILIMFKMVLFHLKYLKCNIFVVYGLILTTDIMKMLISCQFALQESLMLFMKFVIT